MRIVVFGGLARSLLNFRGPLLKALVARGHEVMAWAPDASEAVREELAEIGVRSIHVPMARTGLNPFMDLRTVCAAYRLFRRLRPDHVLSYTIKPVIWGGLAARLARTPKSHAMITGLGYAFSEGNGLKQWLVRGVVRGLYRSALVRSDTVFFQNPDDLATFTKSRLVPSRTRTVLINGSGVDLDWYSPCPLPDQPVFLLVARLLINKGIREYVQAARVLLRRHPQAVFQIAGYCDPNPASIHPEELRAWIREGVIQYLGRLDDVRPAFAGSRVYVLPSYREGTPRTVLEAMAMGRPVITTDAPGCRETIEKHERERNFLIEGLRDLGIEGLRDSGIEGLRDSGIEGNAGMYSGEVRSGDEGEGAVRILQGKNGFLVPVGDTRSLAEVMERFILEPGLAVRMGAEGLRIVREKYDVHKVNTVIMEAMGV